MRRSSKHIAFAVAIALACGVAGGQPEDPRPARVAAATDAARANLRASVYRERIRPGLSVRQFVEQVSAEQELEGTLATAEPVGGPRWLDEQTCQVRVELPAAAVARALSAAAAARPGRSPLSADAVDLHLSEWNGRTFAAVGTNALAPAATPATAAAVASPLTDVALASDLQWTDRLIDAEATAERGRTRLLTARAAEAAVVRALRARVDAAPAGDGKTVGRLAADDPRAEAAVRRAMAQARVTKVDFGSDGRATVRMTLDLADVFRALADVR